ncbi:thioesterase II family protein [Streptomyces abyssomicinicus]|uniref:thioesterase II family protein n=1 Tax=Streptomyces abyssomicinicus TaxID=574929 RepID=UPI001250A1B5|nr:alpha/beta fold hydrolase [Streptomyces abyssomicinicus]
MNRTRTPPGHATGPPPAGYLVSPPDPAAAVRLFCFHHAGGTASVYKGWDRALRPAGISVVPVQLPGRERRVREPRITSLEPLLDALDEHLGPHQDAPYALYGHSMGALVAYGLTLRRLRENRRLPEALVVGAYQAPHLPAPLAAVRGMSDEDLTHLLVDIGGMSPMLLAYPEWRTAALELIRDDLKICHGHRDATTTELPCPVHVLAGTDDPLLTPGQAAEWARHTAGTFAVHVVPGGHLFIRDAQDTVLALLRRVLPASAGPTAR